LTQNIVLVFVHHSRHWLLFVIDITRKTILLFDFLPWNTTPHQTYHDAIVQLLRTHHFYTKRSTIDFNDWAMVNDFTSLRQDNGTSCGIHCALFAASEG